MDVLCMLEPCVKQKLGKPREGFGLGNHFVIYRGICLLWEEMIGIRADGILLDMNWMRNIFGMHNFSWYLWTSLWLCGTPLDYGLPQHGVYYVQWWQTVTSKTVLKEVFDMNSSNVAIKALKKMVTEFSGTKSTLTCSYRKERFTN